MANAWKHLSPGNNQLLPLPMRAGVPLHTEHVDVFPHAEPIPPPENIDAPAPVVCCRVPGPARWPAAHRRGPRPLHAAEIEEQEVVQLPLAVLPPEHEELLPWEEARSVSRAPRYRPPKLRGNRELCFLVLPDHAPHVQHIHVVYEVPVPPPVYHQVPPAHQRGGVVAARKGHVAVGIGRRPDVLILTRRRLILGLPRGALHTVGPLDSLFDDVPLVENVHVPIDGPLVESSEQKQPGDGRLGAAHLG
mmetsp:Transcript_62076/g.196283  ORF Transcript_62076/g.196283 Transcript_62076/m.196283 type:complete len:248 (-) Transcript_62076:717-1460(-)